MRITINGYTIEGNPEEIHDLIKFFEMSEKEFAKYDIQEEWIKPNTKSTLVLDTKTCPLRFCSHKGNCNG